MLTDGFDPMGGGYAATLPERTDAGKTIYPAGEFRIGPKAWRSYGFLPRGGMGLPLASLRQHGGGDGCGGEDAGCGFADFLRGECLIDGGHAAVLIGGVAEEQVERDVARGVGG